MTWEDLQSWCDELSAWITELGEVDELQKAFPKGKFPLVADREKDELEEDKDVLAYLTLWMCCKRRTKAPQGLHARMLLAGNFKGPWQMLYSRLTEALEYKKRFTDLFDLAG